MTSDLRICARCQDLWYLLQDTNVYAWLAYCCTTTALAHVLVYSILLLGGVGSIVVIYQHSCGVRYVCSMVVSSDPRICGTESVCFSVPASIRMHIYPSKRDNGCQPVLRACDIYYIVLLSSTTIVPRYSVCT